MKTDEVARHCDLMGWTSDPVIAVLVDLLLEADESLNIEEKNEPDDLQNAFEKGWFRCNVDTLGMAEKSWHELNYCEHCNASDVFETLVEDIEAAECPNPDDDEDKPETVSMAPTISAKTVKEHPKSKGSPGPEPTILLSIKSVLGQAKAPMKSADLIQAVLNENNSDVSEGSIRNEITKAVKKQEIKKVGHGLYSMP